MKSFVVGALLAVGVAVFAAGAGAKNPNGDQPSPIARGPHVSGVVRYQPKPSPSASPAGAKTCKQPGSGNYMTDCNSSGRPVNETWVTYGPNASATGNMYYAGANDYNSYNGQGQDGFYWSSDGVNWSDAGPIDVFPHNSNYGAGDPGLAVDSNGVVYYSSLFFSYTSCRVGGVELLRRDPSNDTWSYYQIASNSNRAFQDKPAIALSGSNVFVSWTQFSSCHGSGTSPIKVAVLPQGGSSVKPTTTLNVPGSTYSQGSSIASDGNGGFWIAWEEYGTSSPSIMLAHWDSSTGWGTPQRISPGTFKDLPSPLPGFSFRDNSFPALTVVGSSPGNPEVVWTSYDSGVGRAYLWNQGSATEVSPAGGDQFFPSIAPDGSGGVYVAYSQANSGQGTYDQYLWNAGSATKVSMASSNPGNDAFFSGQFIGDYNGMVFDGGAPHPIWTDIRGSDPNYPGWEMDSMFASQGGSTSQGTISFGGSTTLTAGTPASMSVAVTGGSTSVNLSTSSSCSSGCGFASSSSGPFSTTMSLTVGSGGASFYYRDTNAGTPTLTASASGYATATETVTVGAAALYAISVTPNPASVVAGGTQQFTASGTDKYGNPVDVSNADWQTSISGASVSPSTGSSTTTFDAGTATAGASGDVDATVGLVVGKASVTVTTLTAPTNLVATAKGKHIQVSWQDDGSAASFDLYRGSNGAGSETLYASGLTSTSANDMAVSSGTTYWYYVKAVGPNGSLSNASNQDSATPK